MSRVRIPLDLIDSSVTGIYMENLISYWFDQGLTPEHSKVLASLLNLSTNHNKLFVQCLEKEKRDFQTVRNQMMRSLDVWEEVPAWDEVWRLKLAFDRDRKTDWHRNVKLYTIIVCKILPEMVMERNEHEDVWRTKRGVDDPIHFNGTPEWYQEKFEQYQARQAEREESRQRDQEAILRYRALTRGAFDPKASDFAQQLELPFTEDELKRLLDEPCDCPIRWWTSLREGGFTSWSSEHADSSPWQPPDFSSRQQKEPLYSSSTKQLSSPFSQTPATPGHILGMSWKPTGFSSSAKASPLPPDFTSSAAKASPFAKASPLPPDFTSSTAKASPFAKASPLPPDFTSSAAKASPFAKASPLPPDFTSSVAKASPLPPDFTSSAGPEGSWEPPKFLLK